LGEWVLVRDQATGLTRRSGHRIGGDPVPVFVVVNGGLVALLE
jgi:hypothetical protein